MLIPYLVGIIPSFTLAFFKLSGDPDATFLKTFFTSLLLALIWPVIALMMALFGVLCLFE